MPDKLDFNSSTFKNSQTKGIVTKKPNTYGRNKKKSKNPTGIAGLSFLNPKSGRFGSYS